MTSIIFIVLIFLVLKFGMYTYRQGDRQIPTITVLVAIILFITMLLI